MSVSEQKGITPKNEATNSILLGGFEPNLGTVNSSHVLRILRYLLLIGLVWSALGLNSQGHVLGMVTERIYDRNSNLTKIIDANQNETIFEYDEINRPIVHRLPSGVAYQFGYDFEEMQLQGVVPTGMLDGPSIKTMLTTLDGV